MPFWEGIKIIWKWDMGLWGNITIFDCLGKAISGYSLFSAKFYFFASLLL
jgi:hypothetical protein